MSQENVEFVKALYPQPDTDVAALIRDEELLLLRDYGRREDMGAPV
jgi:hypothetical protein